MLQKSILKTKVFLLKINNRRLYERIFPYTQKQGFFPCFFYGKDLEDNEKLSIRNYIRELYFIIYCMKIKIKSGLLAPLFLICLFFSERRVYTLIALTAAAIHELGHIIAAKARKIELSSLSLDLLGARIGTGARLNSYFDEIVLCAAGPLANFIFGAIVILSSLRINEYMMFFAASSIALGTLNSLPIKSFDGGKILTCLLARSFGIYISEKIVSALSFICCFALWCFSVYLLIRVGASLSLFVFSVSLFTRIFISQ